MNGCAKHSGTTTAGSCGDCGEGFCQDCLVYPFGPSRPAMCIGCALAFAGVRQRGGPRTRAPKEKVSWSERRRRKNLPKVQPVLVPEPSLDRGVELGDYEHLELRAG